MKPQEYVIESTKLRRNKQFVKAEKLLEEAFSIYPDNPFIINNLILSYSFKNYNKAKKMFNYAIENDLEDLITCNIYLNILIRHNEYDACESLFKKIINDFKYEDLSITYSTMLNYYVEIKNVNKSLSFFEEIKSLELDSSYNYNLILKLYVKMNDYKKVEEFFNTMVNEDKTDSISYSSLLTSYYKTKEYGKGLRVIKDMPLKHKDNVILLHEIEFYRKLQEYTVALHLIERYLNKPNLRYDNMINANINKAFCLNSLNRRKEAGELFRELYGKVRERDSFYIRIVCGLVLSGGVKENEVSMFENKLNKFPKKGHLIKKTLDALGRMNHKKDGIRTMERSTTTQPHEKFNKQ